MRLPYFPASCYLPFLSAIAVFLSAADLPAQLVINEMMASNLDVVADEDGSFEDWIEIHNSGSDTINLAGYCLSDNPGLPYKWVFPDYPIYPGEYLLVWASGKDRRFARDEWAQGLLREVWWQIPGQFVEDLKNHPRYPDQPDQRHILKQFLEAPRNIADQYGQRIQGWLTPSLTGEYTFWISSDDYSILELGTNDNPASSVQIANVPGWTNPREWNKYPAQQSAPIYLEEGKFYFIRLHMKEGFGGDNLAVKWEWPDGKQEEPLELVHCRIPGGPLHTNFRISAAGEQILLTAPDGTLVDALPERVLPTNISLGRYPDAIGSLVLFDQPTPGAVNHVPGFDERLSPPVIVQPGGVYPGEIEVSLTTDAPGAIIRYTTDGSLPDAGTAQEYQGPILLSQTVVLRAIATRDGSLASEPSAATFIVTAPNLQDFNSNLPLMVINQFDTLITEQDKSVSYLTLMDQASGGRYYMDQPEPFISRSRIEIRGSSSQFFPKKGYSFHLIREDGSNRKESLLGMPEEHNWVLHGPYSDKSLMRNALAYASARDMGDYAPRTRFIELFQHDGNGPLSASHYQGVYLLVERIKIAPGRLELEELEGYHADEPEVTGGYIFKKDRLNIGESGLALPRGNHYAFVRPQEDRITLEQRNWLRDYLILVDEAIMGPGFLDPQIGYREYLDVRTFIDYHLHTELHKQIDGFRLSTFLHKDRSGKLRLGPVWDYNLSWGNANYHSGWNPVGWYHELITSQEYLDGWFNQLFKDPVFGRQYRQRWRELRAHVFSEDQLIGRLREMENLLTEASVRNFQRWPVLGQYVWPNWFIAATYAAEIDWMETWMLQRLAWMDSQLADSSEVVHYWNFNETDLLTPSYTFVGGNLKVESEPGSEVLSGSGQGFSGENARLGDPAGSHLRINNPVGTTLHFGLPSGNFKDLVFAYETRRSGNGANRQFLSYSLDGTNFKPLDTIVVTEVPTLHVWDLRDTAGVNDNKDFAIRVTIDQVLDGTGGMVGNNRFDNVTLDGVLMEGANLPPIVLAHPDFQELVAGGEARVLVSNTFFEDPEGDQLTFIAETSDKAILSLVWVGDTIMVFGDKQGEASLKISATDLTNPSVSLTIRVLVYPAPHSLVDGDFRFEAWDADSPEGSFPEAMLFLQSDLNDPLLETPLLFAYHIPVSDFAAGDAGNIGFPYRNESRTRINGLGDDGISMINTGRGRDLGAALVHVNTTGLDSLLLRWTAGTLRPNSRVYHLRLQYRIGLDTEWLDLPDDTGEPLEYKRNTQEGHEEVYDWSPLPQELIGLPSLYLRWKYYFTGTQLDMNMGARDMLRLDDIMLTRERTSSLGSPAITEPLSLYPNPAVSGWVFFSRVTSGEVFDLIGRRVAQLKDSAMLDVAHLPPGFYIYRDLQGEVLPLVVP